MNDLNRLPAPHPHTTALANAACRFRANPTLSDDRVRAERARLCWLAWIHWSSHSTMRAARTGGPRPNFASLIVR